MYGALAWRGFTGTVLWVSLFVGAGCAVGGGMGGLLQVLVFLLLMAAGETFVLGPVFLQDQPAVVSMRPPEPEDVRASRDFYKEVQAATNAEPGAPETVTLHASTLQSILRLGFWLVPDYRAETEIADDTVRITAALPVPWRDGKRWLNLQAAIVPFEDRFALHHVQLNGRDISPDLALRLARLGGNLFMGAGAGDTLFDAPAAMAIDGDRMIFALRLDRDGRSEVIQGVFGALRGGGMPAPERVGHYYARLREALDSGAVPAQGSLLPLLRTTLAEVQVASTDATAADELAAAFFALARVCGTRDFLQYVGYRSDALSSADAARQRDCRGLSLAGRGDLRQHFVTAAAIKAASNRGFAVSVGEIKELHDSIRGGSGFDFTDIAGNNAGVRLVNLFMSQPTVTWHELINRMTDEESFFPDLADIPAAMPRAQFEDRFGDVDSPAYREMIELIEARIDRTALHAPAPAGGG